MSVYLWAVFKKCIVRYISLTCRHIPLGIERLHLLRMEWDIDFQLYTRTQTLGMKCVYVSIPFENDAIFEESFFMRSAMLNNITIEIQETYKDHH